MIRPPAALRGRSSEFWIAVVGAAAGVVGAAAALAVFVLPSADSRVPQPPVATASVTADGRLSSPTPSTPAASGGPRYLSTVPASAGVGFLRVEGDDLHIDCPSNQSDDTYHDVSYPLPTSYARLAARLTVGGTADAEAQAGVAVFIQHRLDRSDRLEQVDGAVVLKQGASTDFERDLGDAVQLTLRVQCTTAHQSITLTTPRLLH